MMPALEEQFHEAMLAIYTRAKKECDYRATMFLRMVVERGGLEAARQLINADAPSDGYTFLWEHGRLDLSVEAVAITPPFDALFAPEEILRARARLQDYKYNPEAMD